LKLAAASGEIGATMLNEAKHFRLEDQGLVPRAGRTKQPVIVNEVSRSSEFWPNPLLPETRSEAALPMSIGSQLLGVLDLQSDQPSYFTTEYVNVLVTLAEQITIAVRNAQLFEDVRIAREQAERANTVKSAFLASMSHELRTPLNAVLNFSQFLSSGMLGSVNDEQIDMLNKITFSGKHLLNLINDVLDISKIEAGSLRLFVEDNIDLMQEVEVIAATGRALLADKPVEISTEIDPDIPVMTADRRRIRQILLNLVSNACKFTEQGKIVITLQRRADEAHLSIADTGPGIAREDYEAVFEAFRQTNTGIRLGSGTGLGLAISKRLAEIHGGRLWVESEPGSGSTFYVVLPVQTPELTQLQEVAT
jgi:signal transduction histidine kinase